MYLNKSSFMDEIKTVRKTFLFMGGNAQFFIKNEN